MAIRTISYDAIIIGGGGAGMRAALQLAESGFHTAVISKVFATRSHTVSAQGGITCAIASDDPNDDWRWHMYRSEERRVGKSVDLGGRRSNKKEKADKAHE